MKGGKERDRPTYDRADEIGEDPYRWLYVGSVTESCEDDFGTQTPGSSPLMMPIARIRGIQRMDRLKAFQDVEVELGPRKKIMAAINQRKTELESRDDQPARADQLTRSAAADGGER